MLFLPPLAFSEEVTIGAEDDAAPWSYLDGSGYVNDVVRAAYKAVHWNVKLAVFPYSRCKRMAEDGVLVACFTASNIPETRARLQFPQRPVIIAKNILLARSDSPIAGCDPKNWGAKVLVGFMNDYEYLPDVDALRNATNVVVHIAKSEVLSLRMLGGHRIDAAVVSLDQVKRIELLSAFAKVRPDFKVVCDFGGLPGYVAFSLKHPQAQAALKAFNQGMQIIESDGTVVALQQQWARRALLAATVKNQ